jgi:hypothetical protein
MMYDNYDYLFDPVAQPALIDDIDWQDWWFATYID